MKRNVSFELIKSAIKNIIILNLVFLAAMTVFRAVFFIRFADMQSLEGMFYYILKAFYMGVRFDLQAISYVSSLVTLTFLVVWSLGNLKIFKIWLKGVKWYYFAMFSLLFFILFADFGFFSYFKNHLNFAVFGVIEDDTNALFTGIAENYNLFVLSAVLILFFGIIYYISSFFIKKVDLKHNTDIEKKIPAAVKVAVALVLVAINVIAARGSFGLFPLGTMDAEISPNPFINKLALNGLTTLQEAVDFRLKEDNGYDLIKEVGYGGNIEGAFSDFLGIPKDKLKSNLLDNLKRKTPKNALIEKIKPNVILLVMEGFGEDLMLYNSDSFNVLGELKKHFDSDYLFLNFLSGDVGTIGSLETIMLNIPKRGKSRFISQSKYEHNKYSSAATVPYKNAGYETVFLYGGGLGWRNMNVFAPNLGFDIAEGEGSMDPSYEKNQWGVYDEFLFEHLYKRLTGDPEKRKFIMAMTTTNHPPYSLPESYNKLPLAISEELGKRVTGDKKLGKMRFETYQYACRKLGEFISRVKDSKFKDNTIIAVTGDHNFWDVFDYTDEQYALIDSVPFYIYVPPVLRKGKYDPKTFGSHLDIMTTLYNLSLSDREYVSLGSDMLKDPKNSIAFNVDGIIMNSHGLVKCDPVKGTAAYYEWDKKIPGLVERAEKPSENDHKMIKYYKAALAVAEYLVRNPEKNN